MAFKNKPSNKPNRNKETGPLKLTGRSVYVREGEDPTRAFKKLTRKLKESGFFEILRAKEFFLKPSEVRKTNDARAKSRERKRLQKLDENGPLVSRSTRNKENRGKKSKRRDK